MGSESTKKKRMKFRFPGSLKSGTEFMHSGTDFQPQEAMTIRHFLATEMLHSGAEFLHKPASSGTDFKSSGADFHRPIYRKMCFLNKTSRILRPKAYFGAEPLQIWCATIKTHSQSSIQV